MNLGLSLGLTRQQIGISVAVTITGTAPVLGTLTAGAQLSTFVTWGSASTTAPPLTGPTRQMQINGGAWETYVGTRVVAGGETLAVREVWSDAAPSTRPFTSATQSIPVPLPVNTVAPSISGSPVVGQTLTGTEGTWTGSPTLAAQWLRDGSPISGATGLTYVVQAGDVGALLSLRITGTNAGGSVVATSATVGPVVAADAAPFQTVNADGWSVAASDPVAAVGRSVTVSRRGWNASGAEITVSDVLTCTTRVRLPFPQQGTLSADRVALSDFIYSGDTVSGATNASAQPYPLPIAHWLRPDKEIISATNYTARLVVAHAHARLGRPVAAVKFIVTDGSTTVEQTVSAMSTITYTASGFTAPHFAASLDLSGFANGAVLTVDAVIYPWVGDAFQISTQADPYPSPNLTTLRILCNRTGAYGTAFAYVSASGPGATPQVSTNPAIAEANPYGTLDAAATALRAFNNTNFGRNFGDGGVIRLLEGTHIFSNPMRTQGVTSAFPITIEAANPAARATTILRDRGTTMVSSLPDQCVIRSITIQRSATGSFVAYDNGAANLNYAPVMVFDSCVFDANGAGTFSGYIQRTGNGYFINCSEIGPSFVPSARLSTVNKTVKAIGCNGSFSSVASTYALIASRLIGPGVSFGVPGPVVGAPEGLGCMAAFCHITPTSNGQVVVSTSLAIGARGFGLIGCVVEMPAGDTSPVVAINADGNTNPTQNVLLIGNTIVGSRLNFLYQDAGTLTVQKAGLLRFNVGRSRNTKTDVFGANTNLIGNWSVVYNVGNAYNAWVTGSDQNDNYNVGSWLGEVQPVGEVITPINPDWVLDASFDGTRAGSGNYTPGASSQLPTTPSALAPHPVDMLGRPLIDGWRSGALQPA